MHRMKYLANLTFTAITSKATQERRSAALITCFIRNNIEKIVMSQQIRKFIFKMRGVQKIIRDRTAARHGKTEVLAS